MPSDVPSINRANTNALNLKVLRRDDDAIRRILASASSVTMYALDVATTQWTRKHVEGSLFVVQRAAAATESDNSIDPEFQFVVLNRLSDARFVEAIDAAGDSRAEFERSDKYVLYKTATGEVNGIWFYDEKEQKEVYECVERCRKGRIPKWASNVSGGGSGSGGSGNELEGNRSEKSRNKATQSTRSQLTVEMDDVVKLFKSTAATIESTSKQQQKASKSKATASGSGKQQNAAVTSREMSRDAIRNAMLRLATNDVFLDLVTAELNKS